tara:strand:- start:313 stop:1524 length:1212 start_codon:yes stop_codon:yes gene_type:complete
MEQELENVEETQQENQVEETTQIDESKFQSAGDDSVIKVDMSIPAEEPKDEKPEETEEVAASEADDSGVAGGDESTSTTEEQEEVQPQGEVQEETPVLEEITEEEVEEQVEELAEEVEEAVAEAQATGKPLPENIQKLIDFMDETGGDLQDYVRLNQDYSKLDNLTLLREFYKQTKPHLSAEEVDFMMEDSFSYDEEADDEREIKRKKLALKEQVAQARQHLESVKSKHYEEIKYGSKLTKEQQKAIDFFNRYNKDSKESQKIAKEQHNTFVQKTNSVFNKDFKGFDFNVGEKKYRFNVKNVDNVKETQSDINNFIKKFLGKDNKMSDAKGYHKSLYAAMNPDAIAQHFYEQGKADAMKDSVAKAKNVDMNPRQQHGEIQTGGMKFKVLGSDSNDFKFKIKRK